MFKRMVVALESIAKSLNEVTDAMKNIREEQRLMVERAKEAQGDVSNRLTEMLTSLSSKLISGGNNGK